MTQELNRFVCPLIVFWTILCQPATSIVSEKNEMMGARPFDNGHTRAGLFTGWLPLLKMSIGGMFLKFNLSAFCFGVILYCWTITSIIRREGGRKQDHNYTLCDYSNNEWSFKHFVLEAFQVWESWKQVSLMEAGGCPKVYNQWCLFSQWSPYRDVFIGGFLCVNEY